MADKEGARKSPMETVVCCSPDVCKTPMGSATPPVPYPITGMMSQAVGTCTTVDFTGMPAFTMASKIPAVIGDEAGVATGVKSGTVKGTAEPQASSSTVWAEGNLVCRHLDTFGMNCDNTKGKLQCTEVGDGASASSTPDDAAVEADRKSSEVQPETPKEDEYVLGRQAGKRIDELKKGYGETLGTLRDAIGFGEDNTFVAAWKNIGESALGMAELAGKLVLAGSPGTAMTPMGQQASEELRQMGSKIASEVAEDYTKAFVQDGVRGVLERGAVDTANLAAQALATKGAGALAKEAGVAKYLGEVPSSADDLVRASEEIPHKIPDVVPEHKAPKLAAKEAAAKEIGEDGVQIVSSKGPNAGKYKIHEGKQGKHQKGHNNFQEGKSELTHSDAQGLLDKGSGTGEMIGPNKEAVDFGETIGDYRLNGGPPTPTTRGIIHYDGAGGAHIVPAPPIKP